jgi:hypothetical protein
MGVAIGLFIGFLIPVAQILLAAAAAVVLRANVPIAAAGTFVTNPLTVPPIYYAAYQLGAWATGTSATAAVSLADPVSVWESLGSIGLPLFTGLAITASFAAAASYLLISQIWIWRAGEAAEGATMRLFSPLYRRAMVWSRHPHAPWYSLGCRCPVDGPAALHDRFADRTRCALLPRGWSDGLGRCAHGMRRYVDRLGWATVGLLALGLLYR